MSQRFLSRVKIDLYLVALLSTVLFAALVPARGAAEPVTKGIVVAAVFLLFFLYGARLSTRAVLEGIAHWRLQSLVLASTFVLFPLIGLVLTAVLKRWLPTELGFGLMFVCVLPSTVQSSIAFTSIGRGNVPAALCSASVSNLVGMVVTPVLVALLLSTHGSGFSLKALGDIALELLLPFGLGQVLAALGRPLDHPQQGRAVLCGPGLHPDRRLLGLQRKRRGRRLVPHGALQPRPHPACSTPCCSASSSSRRR